MGLKTLREQKGLSIEGLAKKVGCSSFPIRSCERGNFSKTTFKTIKALADYFELTLDELYEEMQKDDYVGFIKSERLKLGVNQMKFGQKIGLCTTTINKLETYGIKEVSPETQQKVADYFGMTIEELIEKDY